MIPVTSAVAISEHPFAAAFELNDFNSQTTKDETFWQDFLFYFYTGASEGIETETLHREDLGFDEAVVKISLQEAEACI